MASIKFSAVVGDARGSIGGNVFSRNVNGAYIRNRTIPINPSTQKQINQRALMSTVISAWRADAEKGKWKYATQISSNISTNRVGESLKYSGYQLFVKRNLQLLSVGYPVIVEPGPDPVFGTGVLAALTLERNIAGDGYSAAVVEFTDEPGSADQTIALEATTFLGAGATSSRQTYRRIATAVGTSDTVDVATELLAEYGVPQVGAQMFFKAKLVDRDSGVTKDLGFVSAVITQEV